MTELKVGSGIIGKGMYITILSTSIITMIIIIIIHKLLTTNQTHVYSMYGIPQQIN